MKPQVLLILAACCLISSACSEPPNAITTIGTKISYSHAAQISGGHEITVYQEIGTIGNKTPNTGQSLSLNDNNRVAFTQMIDASDPQRIRVTIETKMIGFDTETKTLNFTSTAPNPAPAIFKNGLRATVAVNRSTK